MVNHSTIFATTTSWAVWKGKKIWHPKDKPPRSEGVQYATRKWGRQLLIAPERMKRLGQCRNDASCGWDHHPKRGGESQVWYYKERCCTGTRNVRSMNQGKLEVDKQEMARVNISTLGISELKWTGMGEFNSEDHCIYYCGQESLWRYGVTLVVNKRVWNAVLGFNLENDRMISVCFQGKPFNIIIIQV